MLHIDQSRPFLSLLSFLFFSLTLSSLSAAEIKTKILIEGKELSQTNGLNFDSHGNFYVASIVDRSIYKIDPDSGELLDKLGPELGVESPDDLVIDNNGNIYWTSYLTGEIGKLTSAKVKSTVAMLGPGVNGITIANDGSLLVSRIFFADQIWQLDPSGINDPVLIGEGYPGIDGIDMGSDGYLYVPLWYTGQVGRIEVSTGTLEIIANGFITPTAVKLNSTNELFVSDILAGAIYSIDITSGEKTIIIDDIPGVDNIAFDSEDILYFSNSDNGSLHQLKHPNNLKELTPAGLTGPSGLALLSINENTSLFVADMFQLAEYNPINGHLRGSVDVVSAQSAALKTPVTIAPYGDQLLITSWFANSVQIWDPSSQQLTEEFDDFQVPIDAIEFAGDLVVSELGSGCIIRQDGQTQSRTAMACYPSILYPGSLAAKQGTLWVADWVQGAIYRLAEASQTLTNPVLVTSGLLMPEGLAAMPDGSLVTVETGTQRLVLIDTTQGSFSVIVEELAVGSPAPPNFVPTWIMTGIAVDDEGVIYVGEEISH
ncbi:MAG: hypothetical protein JW841_00630, partial [Deltaproteobacteria bacterium]|nr:hypothetical protein [Deltaproteobacteria bacterium]